MRARRIIAFLAAAWRARAEPEICRFCRQPLAPEDAVVCAACMTATSDQIIRARLAELDVNEAIGLARGIAIREGERELAAALQAVLLLHLTGGSLASIAALVQPEPPREAVN